MKRLLSFSLCAVLLFAPSTFAERQPLVYKSSKPAVAVLQDSVVTLARKQVGRKYVYGESTPRLGFDCSGLVQYVLGVFMKIPRTAHEQLKLGLVAHHDSLQPGDLLFFGKTKASGGTLHVGIYLGAGRYINASSVAGEVIERPLDKSRLLTARHILNTD